MSDIVMRLRKPMVTGLRHPIDGEREEAADVIERLRAVLAKLVRRLDEIHENPAYKSVWMVNQLHVGPYVGPTYVDALNEAREALDGEKG